MRGTPLLFLSDSPDDTTGLARIGRDLASRVCADPELSELFTVGFLGRGGLGGKFPWANYTIPHSYIGMKDTREWGSTVIEQVWNDFAGEEKGVVFSIWDPARMIWLSRPEHLFDSPAKTFLLNRPFDLWGYFPIDGHTPIEKGLGKMAEEALHGYNRVLAYTEYGADVMGSVLKKKLPFIPHGLDEKVWFPRDREKARAALKVPEKSFLVGIVAANQRRKDWGLAAEVGQRLKERFGAGNFIQWWHTDVVEREWSLHNLIEEYDLADNTMLTLSPMSDEWMAAAYSACDVTLAIGQGEGFGYPIVESQACGCPVLHSNYAGGACFVPRECRINPTSRCWLDGLSNVMRPIADPDDWFIKAKRGRELPVGDMRPLYWDAIWPAWRRWFTEVYGNA